MKKVVKTVKEKKKHNEDNSEVEQLKGELEIAQNAAKNWENKYYMAYADVENLRKSYEKDHVNIMNYRAIGFIEKLLPVLDGFHIALQMEVKDDTVKNYLVGFEYIYKQMVQALESEGASEIAPKVGEKFDESRMHAVDAVDDEEIEPNTIKQVYANGYMLKNRIVRPAMVIVSKKPSIIDEKQEEASIKTEA